MPSIIHAVHFSKDIFKNGYETRKWLNNHNIKPIKGIHKTENFYEYRINEVIPNKKFVSKYIDNGILFVYQLI
jgi:hypothetical protein